MVYGLRSSFGMLWYDGMDRERVASSSEELVRRYLWCTLVLWWGSGANSRFQVGIGEALHMVMVTI